MEDLEHIQPPTDRWNNDYISPGGVGSVGATLVLTRLRQSNAADFKFKIKGGDVPKGSNVSDGNNEAMYTLGSVARVFDTNWGGRRHFKHKYGTQYHDFRAVDRLVQPLIGATPQYTWQNRVATAYAVRGKQFLPVPGPFKPTETSLSRGQMPTMYNIGAEAYAGAGGIVDSIGKYVSSGSVPVGAAYAPTIQMGLGPSGMTTMGK
jgi:hypothetical protein